MFADIISNINLISGLLLAAGLALLTAEFIIPGFGIPGIAGFILLTVFTAMVAQSPAQFLVIAIILLLIISLIFIIVVTFVSKKRLPHSIRLDDTMQNSETAGLSVISPEIGTTGKTLTALRPSGRAEFNNIPIEVQTEGEYIDSGKEITVIKTGIDGRIYVRLK
ncbi:MAG: hypothetical protein DBX36_02105 [Oscillospiraceae bacterium]|jgi:nodulation efficiency protein D|nr:MAG: hypothetical protein DBX36_02105 [Oscillospiraceae bacterium]